MTENDKYYVERCCRRIAEQLEIPLGTVTKTLSRAYAMLLQSLQQD
jgi:DNA-directed RNA polymerase specialized sigma24 family protein